MSNPQVELHIRNLGVITLELDAVNAPKSSANFLEYVAKGHYDNTVFHRVIPGFMVQGGDPNSRLEDRSMHGTGGPAERLKAEFNDTKHTRRVLSAARTSDPDSAGSQFFLMVADSPHLDGQYTAYGRVTSGMDVVDKIVALPKDHRDNPLPANPARIESIEIVES